MRDSMRNCCLSIAFFSMFFRYVLDCDRGTIFFNLASIPSSTEPLRGQG